MAHVMATQGAAVDRMRCAIRFVTNKTDGLLQVCDGTTLYAKLVAEDLEKEHNADSVKEMEEATLDIITSSNELRKHIKALETLSRSYQPTLNLEVTDFEKMLKDHVKELDAETPFDPEKHPSVKQFKQAVWKVHHAREPMPGQEQEEIVLLGSQTVFNTTCPLTGRPVDQLENPVRSQWCKHIYDRDAVFAYLRRRNRPNPCLCAAAGCPSILVEQQLICDHSLRIEIQEYALRQQSSNVDTVADCTNLEEDDDTLLKSQASQDYELS